MKAGVKKSVKKKHHLYMKYRQTMRYKDYLEYAKQRNITKKAVGKAQADFEKKIMKEFKDKPKQLFNYVREKQKVKSGISRLENEEGNLTEDEKEAANVLNTGASFHFNLWGGGPGAVPPAEVQGAEPLGGGQGAKPPEAPAFLAF